MDTFIGLLHIALFFTLIVGLIKPTLILRWLEQPTRLKVFGFWVLISFAVAVFGMAFENEGERTKSLIEDSKNLITDAKYLRAIAKLNEIDNKNPLYPEVLKLKQKADSLNNMTKEEMLLANGKAAKEKAELAVINQKEQLEREIKSINDGVDFSSNRGSVDALLIEIILFGTWAELITKSENSDKPEVKKLAKRLKLKVMSIQNREFPKIRKDYAEISSKLMWENDIKVFANGTGNRYLNFSGGAFAANKNKKDFQE